MSVVIRPAVLWILVFLQVALVSVLLLQPTWGIAGVVLSTLSFAILILLSIVSRKPAFVEQVTVVAPTEKPAVEAVVTATVAEEPASTEWMQRQQMALDLVRKLNTLVASDTEDAVLKLSQSLYGLLDANRQVSVHIEESLVVLTNGEQGLGSMVGHLNVHVRAFEDLSMNFEELHESLSKDIRVLTDTVSAINEFSDNISDLADQTNVLAINASIEAARVGVHGRGFAVIANQVQVLSKNSKSIAEKMALTVRNVVTTVEQSFARQTERIAESRKLIATSENDLRQWADGVGPHVQRVEHLIEQSRSMASSVTSELNSVTVSLQFQDRIRQVLEHSSRLASEAGSALAQETGLTLPAIASQVRQQTELHFSEIFTVDQEWALLETRPRPSKSTSSVELF